MRLFGLFERRIRVEHGSLDLREIVRTVVKYDGQYIMQIVYSTIVRRIIIRITRKMARLIDARCLLIFN